MIWKESGLPGRGGREKKNKHGKRNKKNKEKDSKWFRKNKKKFDEILSLTFEC